MRVLVVSHNLVGDGLWISPVLQQFMKENPAAEMVLETDANYISYIYYGMGIRWKEVVFGEASPDLVASCDCKLVFRAGDAGALSDKKKIHIAEAYAEMNGINLPGGYVQNTYGRFKALVPIYCPVVSILQSEEENRWWEKLAAVSALIRPLVVVSPFSKSCSSHSGLPPNKELPWLAWSKIIKLLQQWGEIVVVGGPEDEDRLPPDWGIEERHRFFGLPIPHTARLMQMATMVVTVDNGMGHLAASQNANHILFYPMCLGLHFIVPWGANKTVPIQIEPVSLLQEAPLNAVLYAIGRAAKTIFKL